MAGGSGWKQWGTAEHVKIHPVHAQSSSFALMSSVPLEPSPQAHSVDYAGVCPTASTPAAAAAAASRTQAHKSIPHQRQLPTSEVEPERTRQQRPSSHGEFTC